MGLSTLRKYIRKVLVLLAKILLVSIFKIIGPPRILQFGWPINAAILRAFCGGVRVGLEDNIWFDTARTRLATNSDLLLRIHKLAEATGRKVMSPGKLRELLNLQTGHGKYSRSF